MRQTCRRDQLPPPPWLATGQCGWPPRPPPVGSRFRLTFPPWAARGRLVIALARFRGTLSYDEFAVGSLVRRGTRGGLWCQRIWIDDAASLWGGRRLWGIPKQLARFDWTGPPCR